MVKNCTKSNAIYCKKLSIKCFKLKFFIELLKVHNMNIKTLGKYFETEQKFSIYSPEFQHLVEINTNCDFIGSNRIADIFGIIGKYNNKYELMERIED
jgi:hypothetical protein